MNVVSPVEVGGSVTRLVVVVEGELVTGAERNESIRENMIKLITVQRVMLTCQQEVQSRLVSSQNPNPWKSARL